MLMLLSGAIYGTYPVLIRALKVVGGEPLPSAFVTFVRYQFLMLMAFGLRAVRAIQARSQQGAAADKKSSAGAPSKATDGMRLAAFELATYTVFGTWLSVWGVARISSVTSEILASTIHVFVPLLSLGLIPDASFGRNTWLGCTLAFTAATISCLFDSAPAGGAAASAAGASAVDWLGNGAVVVSTAIYALQKVRTQRWLVNLDAEALNTARMVCMGAIGCAPLLLDLVAGGGSRQTLGRLGHVVFMQWFLLGLSVFLSAFVGSALQFAALKTISAANAQPFVALQPLFAAGWSTLLLSEPISQGAMLGGGLMIGATLLACTDKSGKAPAKDKKA